MTFFKWTTWFTTSSPGLFPRNNGSLLDLFRQSGFRKHHGGSEMALFKMKVDELLLNLDNNGVSGVLLVDYCKTFDMVDHNLLLLKLEAYGFTNRAYNWLASHPDVLRGSSRVRGAGTRDEPLRSSAWEANNRPIRLTQCCTQFKPFGNKTFCFRNFHTFKWECHIIMQIQYTKNLNPGRFELGKTLS